MHGIAVGHGFVFLPLPCPFVKGMVSAQNLPTDIVQEIFKYFSAPLVIPTPDPDKDNVIPFPWYLGHICSSWRSTFLTMYPYFWGTITICVHRRYRHWNKAVSVAEFFLKRTEGRSFSFSVDARFPCPPILDLFIAESTRWKAVSLRLDDEDEIIPQLRCIKHHIPQLRSLSLNIELGMPRDFSSIFEDAPALSHLSLRQLGNWHTDWSLLTRLALTRQFNISHLLYVLSQTTNLEHLEFNKPTVDPKGLEEKGFEPVTLPRLRILEIFGLSILQYLTTPRLQGLYVYRSRSKPMGEICSSFFTRSSCSLQRLGATFYYKPQGLVDILRLTPDLKVLSLCYADLTELIKIITCRMGEQALVPQLAVLRLPMDEVMGDQDQNAVERMIESRVSDRFLHSVQEFRTVVLYRDDDFISNSRWHFSHWRYCQNPNIQTRLLKETYHSANVPAIFRWLCDDDCL